MKRLFRITTISGSLKGQLKGQLSYLSKYYEVIGVASNQRELEDVEEREGIQTYCIEMKREISPFRDLISLWKLFRYFKREKPYIVHANTPKASLLSMFAAKLAGVPHRVYTVTGLRFETATGLFRKLLITMEKLTCASATKVIPEGEGVKETILRERITSKSMQIVHNGNINGIDTTHFSCDAVEQTREELREKYNIKRDDFVFIFVGRMVKDKGINELIEAFSWLSKKYSNAKLLLVGSYERELDPIKVENEQEIESNPNIIPVGYQNDVRPFFKMADVLTFPSYREGFPNVVMQAGAMGLPSIVTDINGCNEIIIEGENGVIIPPKKVTALRSEMERFMADTDLLKILQVNARNLICSRYEQRDVWEAILRMYQSLDKNN